VILEERALGFYSGLNPDEDFYPLRQSLKINLDCISAARLQSAVDLRLQRRPGTFDLYLILITTLLAITLSREDCSFSKCGLL